MLRGSPLEQHPFPRLQGTWVTREMQASKARMNPGCRSTPRSACDVNGHLDKHKPAAWFFIPAILFPEQTSEPPSQASAHKEAFVLSGPGKRVFHLQTLSQRGIWALLCPAGVSITVIHSFLVLTAHHERFPGIPSSLLCAQAEWALGAEGNLPAKVSWHSGLRLEHLQHYSTDLGSIPFISSWD